MLTTPLIHPPLLHEGGVEPDAVSAGYRDQIGARVSMHSVGRSDFYDACRGPDLAVLVATGDVRTYANLLLTIGVTDVT